MAYNALATAVTGDLWTAANHNTYIKDNFAAGVPDIFTAAGDIAYATGANAAAPLAVGAARQGLFVNAGATAPEWSSILFGCSVSLTTDQAISAGSTDKIIFDTENYDTSDLWSSSDADAVLIPFDGIFHISGVIEFAEGVVTSGKVYVGDVQIDYVSNATSTNAEVVNFTYINRFVTGADVCLSVYTQGGNTISGVDYSVYYLGAST